MSSPPPESCSLLSTTVHLRVVSGRGLALDDQAEEVLVDTAVGQLAMHAGHLPTLAVVVPGVLSYAKGEQWQHVALSGGFVEFRPNEVLVLARTAERAADIDLDRSQATYRELSRQMLEMGMDDPAWEENDHHRRRAAARIRAVELSAARKR